MGWECCRRLVNGGILMREIFAMRGVIFGFENCKNVIFYLEGIYFCFLIREN
jgi:hypothetical protein